MLPCLVFDCNRSLSCITVWYLPELMGMLSINTFTYHNYLKVTA